MEIKPRRKRAAKEGLPPGTPVYTGTRVQDKTSIRIIEYGEKSFTEKTLISIDEITTLKNAARGTVRWIQVQGLSDQAMLSALAQRFSIHTLALEDILHVDQLPKIEVFPEEYFLVTGLWSIPSQDLLSAKARQISLILQDTTLISFSEEAEEVFARIEERITQKRGIIRKEKAVYCLYSLLDSIMDSYFLLCDGIEGELDGLEDCLEEDEGIQKRIQQLRKFLSKLRRYLMPLRESLQVLARELGSGPLQAYFRDLIDHDFQVVSLLESYRESLTGLHDLYLSNLSNKMNRIMKVLTLISTIFLPLTFLAGVYGMNFANMPELYIPWAYPILLLVMVSIAVGMLLFFRRKKWL